MKNLATVAGRSGYKDEERRGEEGGGQCVCMEESLRCRVFDSKITDSLKALTRPTGL